VYKRQVAIDLGWRKFPHGLRVGCWRDHEGRTGEILIPQAQIERFRKVADLQSIRDRQFDVSKATLQSFLAPREEIAIPAWLRERCAHLHQWRSAAKLASMVLAWRNQRFDGDASVYAALEAWRAQDKHLYDWQEAQRQNAMLHRRDQYRNLAATFRRTYRTAVIEEIDWRDFAKLPDPLTDTRLGEERWYNRIAAVSYLIADLRHALTEVVEKPPEWTTQACHHCGQIDHFDARAELTHTCSACRTTWDQDDNACCNLLKLHAGGGPLVATAVGGGHG
jgi:hypothetical protein